ncbi:hypothetical protein CHGG_03836 [Chaetomium globosum CBS 148.51]|uniref:RING-type domain-containing protein n=1 Tax=Chaetomium globosum (strain ATCC 6205 / CBS 148.51 / DSM 1962 / NBRC 6347 / NRRL 1970) TaxID=306901 RepID=Q2H310_CHAGB|nr:uncharacterized protein CHGG_03836 [Chaetomium globosum CBS 148.51]EAQ87217.1 hypothetical protein CHGG_03836 [Chaetomium globosum CBS 148.51]
MGFADLLGASSVETGGRSSMAPSESTSSLSMTLSLEETAVATSGYTVDEGHLILEPERPDLRELNSCLDALAAIFPNIQIEVFRDMLASFDGESRLSLVADELLKNDISWVKGRWRVATEPGQAEEELVPKKETFRSPQYKQAAKSLAWHEFKGLSRSAINAVLAENNYSYLDARQTLVDLSSKSWRFTISSLFRRRKPVSTTDAKNHPLVIWKPTGQGSTIPTLRSTGNAELDQELFAVLIAPLRKQARAAREAEDYKMASRLNNLEAEQTGSMFECACCFDEGVFEEFTSCNDRGHMLCFRCVQHSASEAVFGQGWQRSINQETGGLRCIAVDSEGCTGHICNEQFERAVLQADNGPELLRQLQDRVAEYSLAASNLPFARCPFCGYAEVDETYQPVTRSDFCPRINEVNGYLLAILGFFCMPFLAILGLCCIPLVPLLVLANMPVIFFLVVLITTTLFDNMIVYCFRRFVSEMREAVIRRRERNRGLQFNCRRPGCERKSCLSCEKGWADVHVCHVDTLDALRTQIEQAMSLAIKRVCPRCNTSFVRSSGCNKMTCPCGYEMCYICRQDISGKGPHGSYQHFCNHFWADPTKKKCTECTRCTLYQVEDEEAVLRKAREEAERRWRSTEARELSRAETVYLERWMLPPSTNWGLGAAIKAGLAGYACTRYYGDSTHSL